jgi:hypothetical protein
MNIKNNVDTPKTVGISLDWIIVEGPINVYKIYTR